MAIRIRRRPRPWVVIAGFMSLTMVVAVLLGLNRPLPTYLVASGTLQPGVVLSESDFEFVELDLGPIAANYAQAVPKGQTVANLIRAGELVPTVSLRDYSPAGLTSIRFMPASRPASETIVGSHVAVWQVVEVDEVATSQLLVPRSLVVAVDLAEGLFADTLPELELQLYAEQATLVMAAMAADYPLFVLPTL